MRRRLRLSLRIPRALAVLVTVVAAVVLGSGAPAVAAPPAPNEITITSDDQWPTGMPADLKAFFHGSAEFAASEWGASAQCADKGGDYGTWVFHALRVEARLAYWSAPASARITMYMQATGVNEDAATDAIKAGKEPDHWPSVFPGGDETASPLRGVCAGDLARWTRDADNKWGFDWAAEPDAASVEQMRKQPFVDNLPDNIFTANGKCSDIEMLCAHAFFVNCDQTQSPNDARRCREWNTQIGVLFGRTWDYVDRNKNYWSEVADVFESSGLAEANGFNRLVAKYLEGYGELAGTAIQLFTDPAGVIDEWANKLKASAVALTTAGVEGIAGIKGFDLGGQNFLVWYARYTGLGMIVFAVTILFVMWRISRKHDKPMQDVMMDLLYYAPGGLVAMMFTPGVAGLIVEFVNGLTDVASSFTTRSIEDIVTSLSSALGGITADTLVGGVITGILLFGALTIGALSLVFGVLMHEAAKPVLVCAAGLAYGLWAHPDWRQRAVKPLFIFLGITFGKPVLFLTLGLMGGLMGMAADGAYSDGKLASLAMLGMITVCVCIIGFAPWTLLAWFPFLPTKADSANFGSSGSSVGQNVGGAAQTANSALQQTARGGGSGAGSTAHSSLHVGGAGGGAAATKSEPTVRDLQRESRKGGASSAGHASTQHGAGHATVPTGAARSTSGAGGGAGLATGRLVSAASSAASLGVGAGLVATSVGGAVLDKAARSAQNAPEQAEGPR